MINMQMTKAEAKEENGTSPDLPRYPYGLCLSLDDETMAKLGLTTLPAIGTVMLLQAQVKVTATRAYESQSEAGEGNSDQSFELQITDMELQGGARDLAGALYSKSK